MLELALELIQRAKEEHWLHLDLANCGLTEIPPEVFELTWLESLVFSDIPNPEQTRLCYKEINDTAAQDRFCSRLANQMNQRFDKLT